MFGIGQRLICVGRPPPERVPNGTVTEPQKSAPICGAQVLPFHRRVIGEPIGERAHSNVTIT